MIKIQKEDFNSEEEIEKVKNLYSNVGAVTSFTGYVRDFNNNNKVQSIDLEVYSKMAYKQLQKILDETTLKWNVIDCLIIHRYGKLNVNSKIVLVSCFSEHRNDSFESCKFIMDYLKKDAPFWKNEYYNSKSEWLKNSN